MASGSASTPPSSHSPSTLPSPDNSNGNQQAMMESEPQPSTPCTQSESSRAAEDRQFQARMEGYRFGDGFMVGVNSNLQQQLDPALESTELVYHPRCGSHWDDSLQTDAGIRIKGRDAGTSGVLLAMNCRQVEDDDYRMPLKARECFEACKTLRVILDFVVRCERSKEPKYVKVKIWTLPPQDRDVSWGTKPIRRDYRINISNTTTQGNITIPFIASPESSPSPKPDTDSKDAVVGDTESCPCLLLKTEVLARSVREAMSTTAQKFCP